MEAQVLDLAQLARIQGTHRGFLYQHLYAAACLLAAPTSGVVAVRVERDEDVELVHEAHVVYAQVKTRSACLSPSDVEGQFERFDAIRDAHARGDRTGVARFALIANVELGPTLARQMVPSDVMIVTPTTPADFLRDTGLILPPPTVAALLARTQELANGYRLSALRPDSLVAKLVGIMAHAAAGERATPAIATTELGRLCELIAAQVSRLPRVARYRPQIDEPALPDDRGSLVVLGHAGDGKTAWAAEVTVHTPDVAVYIACSPAPGEQVAARLVDATVSTLVVQGNLRPYDLVLPGRTGVAALTLLDHELVSRGIAVTAVLDDCHHATAATILEAMRAARSVRWILLGRPGEALDEVAALMSLPRVTMQGWNDDVVASLLHDEKCLTRPADVAALRSATKGAPLFVLHAVQTIRESRLDTGDYARSLVAGTTVGRTPQERLLEGAVRALDPASARVASALAAIEIGLDGSEWVDLVARAIGDQPALIKRSLRVLVDRLIAHETERGFVAIHDALRPLLDGRFLSSLESRQVKESAAVLLRAALLDERASERITAFVRILASLGRLSDLADVANALSEWFRETGTLSEVRGHLEAVLRQGTLSPEDTFWALDTLAFFDIEEERTEQAAARLPEMERLAPGLDEHARGAVQHKKLLVALRSNDIDEVRSVASIPAPTPAHARVLRYHVAVAEAVAGDVKGAVLALLDVAGEHLTTLGLTPKIVFAKGPDQLRALMSPDADTAVMRHLGDCYFAMVRITAPYPEYRKACSWTPIWAMKFYDLAGASRSALRAGQDTVDLMLDQWDDPDAARTFMEESLLPATLRARLPEMTVPIRAQYAVVCAQCGDFARADAEMLAVIPYKEGLPPEGRAELENQRKLIALLRARGPLTSSELEARRRRIEAQVERLKTALARRASSPSAFRVSGKVGRNESCPCGSGRKFKRCCGGAS